MEFDVVDIETNALVNPDKIHVISVGNSDGISSLGDYASMASYFESASNPIVMHNGICYDVPIIKRILDVEIPVQVIDSLAVSWYLFPTKLRHGLEEWGEHYGYPKVAIEDWVGLSYGEYRRRCERDVEINKLLWADCL